MNTQSLKPCSHQHSVSLKCSSRWPNFQIVSSFKELHNRVLHCEWIYVGGLILVGPKKAKQYFCPFFSYIF